MPVVKFLRKCHWIGRAEISASRLAHRSSMGVSAMWKVVSEGKGRRCLGKPVIPRAAVWSCGQPLRPGKVDEGKVSVGTIAGRKSVHDHPTAHRLVFEP